MRCAAGSHRPRRGPAARWSSAFQRGLDRRSSAAHPHPRRHHSRRLRHPAESMTRATSALAACSLSEPRSPPAAAACSISRARPPAAAWPRGSGSGCSPGELARATLMLALLLGMIQRASQTTQRHHAAATTINTSLVEKLKLRIQRVMRRSPAELRSRRCVRTCVTLQRRAAPHGAAIRRPIA